MLSLCMGAAAQDKGEYLGTCLDGAPWGSQHFLAGRRVGHPRQSCPPEPTSSHVAPFVDAAPAGGVGCQLVVMGAHSP